MEEQQKSIPYAISCVYIGYAQGGTTAKGQKGEQGVLGFLVVALAIKDIK